MCGNAKTLRLFRHAFGSALSDMIINLVGENNVWGGGKKKEERDARDTLSPRSNVSRAREIADSSISANKKYRRRRVRAEWKRTRKVYITRPLPRITCISRVCRRDDSFALNKRIYNSLFSLYNFLNTARHIYAAASLSDTKYLKC